MTNALVGQPAPAFALTDQHGRVFRLDSARGRNVLLVFVPFAFSDTCTSELVDLRDATDLLARDDLTVLIVSCDSVYTMKAWADSHRYTAPLLSDFWPHGAVATAYGVLNTRKGLANRGTFLIDGDGIVRWSVVNPEGRTRDVDDYRAAVAAL